MVEQVIYTDQTALAVAEQEDGFPWLPAFDHIKINCERVSEIFKSFDPLTPAVRFAMTKVVQSINSIPKGDEVVDHIHLAAAIFANTMDNQQNSIRIPIREPSLIVNVGILYSFEVSFDMVHGAS